MRRVSTGRAAALSIRSHTLSGCDCKCQHVPLSPCCVKLEGAITHLSWVLASSAFLAACTTQTDNAAKTSISHTYSMNTQFNTCSVNLSLDLTYQKTQHQTLTAAPSMCSCLITGLMNKNVRRHIIKRENTIFSSQRGDLSTEERSLPVCAYIRTVAAAIKMGPPFLPDSKQSDRTPPNFLWICLRVLV